ncbi:MAG: DUF4214 domain-containing protein, partial [Acetobacteraceae bacterium]|nr:DUF4214 domain-containing protein [Acetobacteraceae bacterium]
MGDNTAFVQQLYHTALHRDGEPAGLQAWTQTVAAGTSLQSVAQAFLDSPEYGERFGSPSDTAFVDALYAGALGRPADTTGLEGWTEALAHGTTRAEVGLGLAASPAAVKHTPPPLEAG